MGVSSKTVFLICLCLLLLITTASSAFHSSNNKFTLNQLHDTQLSSLFGGVICDDICSIESIDVCDGFMETSCSFLQCLSSPPSCRDGCTPIIATIPYNDDDNSLGYFFANSCDPGDKSMSTYNVRLCQLNVVTCTCTGTISGTWPCTATYMDTAFCDAG